MKHLKTLTEWTSWRDDLYEPGETWATRVASWREEQKRLEEEAKKKKRLKTRKAIPPKARDKVMTSPDWKEREYTEELREKLSNENIEVEYIGEIESQSLEPLFIKNGIKYTDISTFCRYVKTAKHFRLKFSYNLQKDIRDIFKIYSDDISVEMLKTTSYIKIAYWINMGNGLTTIIIEEEELYFSTCQIYTGEKDLIKLLEDIDPNVMLNAERYNL